MHVKYIQHHCKIQAGLVPGSDSVWISGIFFMPRLFCVWYWGLNPQCSATELHTPPFVSLCFLYVFIFPTLGPCAPDWGQAEIQHRNDQVSFSGSPSVFPARTSGVLEKWLCGSSGTGWAEVVLSGLSEALDLGPPHSDVTEGIPAPVRVECPRI